MDEQPIRFTDEPGHRIAWTRTGSGPTLVLAGWWGSRLELWNEPRFRAFVEGLARHRTVVRYEVAGTSRDHDPPAGSLEDEVASLAAVVAAVDASPADPIELVAGSSGAPVGIAYATAHPGVLRRLVIYGGYASGSEIADERTREAIVRLVREHWGLGSRTLADVFIPSADPAEREAFGRLQRRSASAEEAAEALRAVYRFDVADRLAQVDVPTAVLHRRGDRAIPFALGRRLAAGIPGATFVGLDGTDHYPWFGDATQVLRATRQAIGVPDGRPGVPAPSSQPPAATEVEAVLTERETQVLALIAAGLSDREVAERLVLSPHTVHRHVANLRTKLGLPTRAAAVAAAARRGLL